MGKQNLTVTIFNRKIAAKRPILILLDFIRDRSN
jgi:hypothetical protein